jgi:dihydrofolate reductase
MMTTVDGFFEGANRDISWHNVDLEFNEFAIRQLDESDTLLFGRVTYQLMAGYWPTREAVQNDPIVAGKMNSLPKIVFSRTLENAGWNNTKIIRDNITDEIVRLKKQPGKEIAVFGSSGLGVSLLHSGLLDELRIMINPVVLANGTRLFEGIDGKLDAKLTGLKAFRSGNVLLYYEPGKRQS